MSTRSRIARWNADRTAYESIYHHSDGYPSGLGQYIYEAITGHFKGDIKAFTDYIFKHPQGWSSLSMNLELPQIFSEGERISIQEEDYPKKLPKMEIKGYHLNYRNPIEVHVFNGTEEIRVEEYPVNHKNYKGWLALIEYAPRSYWARGEDGSMTQTNHPNDIAGMPYLYLIDDRERTMTIGYTHYERSEYLDDLAPGLNYKPLITIKLPLPMPLAVTETSESVTVKNGITTKTIENITRSTEIVEIIDWDYMDGLDEKLYEEVRSETTAES